MRNGLTMYSHIETEPMMEKSLISLSERVQTMMFIEHSKYTVSGLLCKEQALETLKIKKLFDQYVICNI